MTNSDIQRIEEAAQSYDRDWKHITLSTSLAFRAGAQYEHPIAWNAAIDEVMKKFDPVFAIKPDIKNIVEIATEMSKTFDEIQKLRK